MMWNVLVLCKKNRFNLLNSPSCRFSIVDYCILCSVVINQVVCVVIHWVIYPVIISFIRPNPVMEKRI